MERLHCASYYNVVDGVSVRIHTKAIYQFMGSTFHYSNASYTDNQCANFLGNVVDYIGTFEVGDSIEVNDGGVAAYRITFNSDGLVRLLQQPNLYSYFRVSDDSFDLGAGYALPEQVNFDTEFLARYFRVD